jgi:hypothetical protein
METSFSLRCIKSQFYLLLAQTRRGHGTIFPVLLNDARGKPLGYMINFFFPKTAGFNRRIVHRAVRRLEDDDDLVNGRPMALDVPDEDDDPERAADADAEVPNEGRMTTTAASVIEWIEATLFTSKRLAPKPVANEAKELEHEWAHMEPNRHETRISPKQWQYWLPLEMFQSAESWKNLVAEINPAFDPTLLADDDPNFVEKCMAHL